MADEVEEVKWRRVFAVSSLLVALVLLSAGIYFHVQQRTLQEARAAAVAAAADTASYDYNNMVNTGTVNKDTLNEETVNKDTMNDDYYYGEDDEDTIVDQRPLLNPPSRQPAPCHPSPSSEMKSVPPPPIDRPSTPLLSEVCLQCICETATECRSVECSGGVSCGLFRISRLYWTDAGRPTVQGAADAGEDEDKAYSQCVNNPFCSARAVSAVVTKYARDCNQDGVVDCQDHAALHILGPTGCQRDQLLPIFRLRLLRCLARFASPSESKQ